MKTITATRSCRYANPAGPSLPQVELVNGIEYDIEDDAFADRIIELEGAVEVESKIENTDASGEIEFTVGQNLILKDDEGEIIVQGEVTKVLKHDVDIGDERISKADVASVEEVGGNK